MFAFHSAGATAFSQSYFDGGTGGILLDNVGCSGQEQYLVDCRHLSIGVHNCDHSKDAGVFCILPRELIKFHMQCLLCIYVHLSAQVSLHGHTIITILFCSIVDSTPTSSISYNYISCSYIYQYYRHVNNIILQLKIPEVNY